MPAALAAKAAEFAASGAAPAVPRVAATVVLLRPAESGGGVEAYVLRRAASMAAFAGMYAFPGGGVDPADADAEVGWAGPDPARWARRLALPEPQARAVVAAAVREVFEEAGVLLAGPDAHAVVADVDTAAWEATRQALLRRERSLTGVLADAGLVLRSDLLVPWSRWITPDFEPRRYDTYFFVAALPAGQQPRHVSDEADRVHWVTPGSALAAWHAGTMAMLPPTASTLESLAEAPSVAAALAAARHGDPSRPVIPRLETVDGQPYAVVD
nr:NUDIX domain-containing protein [Pilimelia terevasa]